MQENESYQAILQTLISIPKGKVCTYGTVAKLAGVPGKSRYVGLVLKNLPPQSSIPWHRVINSQGKSSFPEQSEKYCQQMHQLNDEGVFAVSGKINLKIYLWEG